MTILINVINQELRLATPFRTLVNGTQEFIKFKFVLDDAWLKITTFAQFIQDGTAYNVYLDDNKCVFLPREINSGTFTLMLYGTGGHVIGTSNYLTLKMIDNIFVGDAQSTEITESLYIQLVNIVNSYGDKIDAKVSHSEYSQLVNRVNTLDNTIKDKIGTEEFESFEEEMGTKIENIKQLIGTPVVAQSSSKMTDKTKIYIYTGDEAGYIKGNWYYYDGTKWVSGGSYGGGVSRTDKTLTQSDVPADAKVVGDKINNISSLSNKLQSFISNTDIDYAFDSATNANYTVIRIYKNKSDGTKQYPFVYAPNGTNTGTMSTMDLIKKNKWVLAINSGIFDMTHCTPDGIVIQNGTVIKNAQSTTHPNCKPLTIDSNGDLSYANYDADANTLVANGIISAVCGFMPIIIDYDSVPQSEWNTVSHYTENAQRQIIGQFGNGDYAIVTCEGRNFDNSDGWTIAEAQTICQRLGLKFAYNLDGGGSTETMIGEKHINTIYERTTGRIVPTFIVFNGTDKYEIPSSDEGWSYKDGDGVSY